MVSTDCSVTASSSAPASAAIDGRARSAGGVGLPNRPSAIASRLSAPPASRALRQPVAAPVGVPTPTLRANFNDVDEYNGLLDVGACDQFGNPLSGLSGYTVSVAVVQTSALSGIAPANARRIDVSVTDPTGVLVTLSGYRANF